MRGGVLALAWRYLWARPLVSGLNLLLLSLGLAAVSFVLLVSEQIEAGVRRDLAGVDLVVGAKGSPMQIMLAGLFHLDVPTGNIPLTALDELRAQPLVASAVPLSLGDSLKGFRIVGTTADYPVLYQGRLAQGRWWSEPLEAVLGAEVAQATGLRPGDSFAGSHGLGEGGHEHGDHRYKVVGVLAPGGTVLDRLVLTDLASVWKVHEDMHAVDESDRRALEAEREITLALVRYRSPLAAVSLPRWVNAQDGLQAAAPALETARLLRMVGAGTEVLRGFGAVLLLAAGLSVFVALLHAVRERQGDLAMLRMLGAPPWRVGLLIAAEAAWLALLASALGLALGHGLTALLGWVLAQQQSLRVVGGWFSVWELLVPALALLLALVSSAWPAWRAYRLDVTELLQAPH
ncbi:ABC transporter permease [Kinneretia asaccharophila]|jgi:putative ABC transport system permease protein|uniref:Putative ABC transport system permease protein n=1 Tax=Roseateles asaccharophilus TaxID=582607 RepID=A0A4R6N311_9BURK|nr:FtsX-like permease family protein [Roseateles asaccharophilus]MDN3544690.1 ABC transporter permease [Roseateles asaccharophilus]TDP09543.1 putative ABC transport system permease protein [Roseateles asaccharophilus]